MNNYRHQKEIPAHVTAQKILTDPTLKKLLVAGYGTALVKERIEAGRSTAKGRHMFRGRHAI